MHITSFFTVAALSPEYLPSAISDLTSSELSASDNCHGNSARNENSTCLFLAPSPATCQASGHSSRPTEKVVENAVKEISHYAQYAFQSLAISSSKRNISKLEQGRVKPLKYNLEPLVDYIKAQLALTEQTQKLLQSAAKYALFASEEKQFFLNLLAQFYHTPPNVELYPLLYRESLTRILAMLVIAIDKASGNHSATVISRHRYQVVFCTILLQVYRKYNHHHYIEEAIEGVYKFIDKTNTQALQTDIGKLRPHLKRSRILKQLETYLASTQAIKPVKSTSQLPLSPSLHKLKIPFLLNPTS